MHAPAAPSPWVVRHAPLITTGGHVLDMACGTGRHAIWLAQQGFTVDAVDRDATALSAMTGHTRIRPLIADLEQGVWPYPNQWFDGIVVSRYLHRPWLPQLANSLSPGGVLIYETFMVGNERHGKPSTPAFLLRPNELLEAYAPLLNLVAFEQGETPLPTPAVMQRLCATKP